MLTDRLRDKNLFDSLRICKIFNSEILKGDCKILIILHILV